MATTYLWKDFAINPTEKEIFLEGEDAIVNAIYNILSVFKGEWLFDPTYGAGYDALLFEMVDDLTVDLLLSRLTEDITSRDPRILVGGGSNVVLSPDENKFDVDLRITLLANDNESRRFKVIFAIDRALDE